MKHHSHTIFLGMLLLISSLKQSTAQLPLHWEDIKTGQAQASVYIPPPTIFSEGIRTADFAITYNGFTPDAQAAFQYAADIWSSLLNSTVSIKVNTYFAPLLPGLLGITLPNGRKDFPGATQANTWFATSLANSIAGTELNTGEFDFDLYLNSTMSWYYGVDGNCPAGKYDLVSIVLHEMCHGLGFVGLGKVSGTTGSFGLLQAADFAPIATSFPWPDLDTLPSIFDSKLQDSGGNFLSTFPNPSTELKSLFTGNQVYFDGENASLMNGGVKPRMYAPSTFSLGSSLLHLNETTYPAGNINELMTPFAGASNAVHDPGPIVMGILKDIGWSVNYNVGIENVSAADESIQVYPNPATDHLFITACKDYSGNLQVLDAVGHCVLKADHIPSSINIAAFNNGLYILQWRSDGDLKTIQFIKN
ncbi:MAG TPA: T9SS type A sorting domain-containing protein [Chitinophagales bacterium]|nr:T9SS type A sorting domain-containing protein [Chitinophagales bacterium]